MALNLLSHLSQTKSTLFQTFLCLITGNTGGSSLRETRRRSPYPNPSGSCTTDTISRHQPVFQPLHPGLNSSNHHQLKQVDHPSQTTTTSTNSCLKSSTVLGFNQLTADHSAIQEHRALKRQCIMSKLLYRCLMVIRFVLQRRRPHIMTQRWVHCSVGR